MLLSHLRRHAVCSLSVEGNHELLKIHFLKPSMNELFTVSLFLFVFFQPNVMVFIAELFWWFENVKPDFVQPRDVQELKDGE